MDENLKDTFEKFIKMLNERLEDSVDVTGKFTKTLNEAEKKLKKLERLYESGSEGLKDLEESLKDGSANALDSLGSFKSFNSQLLKSGKAIDAETQSRINNIRKTAINESVMKGFMDTTEAAGKALVDMAIGGLKTVITQLQGTGDAFSMFTELTKQSIDATNKVNQAASQGAESLGATLTTVLPGYFKLFGVALMGVARLFGYVSEKTSELAKFGIETLNAEVQKTIKSFNDASKAGIFFVSGMSELQNIAHDTGVSYRDMIGALKGVNADLAQLGGSAGNGAIQVSKTFKAMEPFRRGLLNLGIGVEEQIQGAAEYMSMLSRAGQLEGKTATDLAKGTDSYLTNLKAITSITGEEVKAAESRARKAAEQALVQDTLNSLSGDSAEKFKNLIKMFPQFEVGISQLFTTGAISNKEQAVAIYNNTALMNVLGNALTDVRNASIGSKDALQNVISGFTNNAKEIKASSSDFAQSVGLAAQHTGQFGESAQASAALQRMANQAENGQLAEALKRTEAQKNTNDDLTNAVSNATVEFQKMQAALEVNLYEPMKNFAKVANAMIEEMDKKYKESMGLFVNTTKPEAPGTSIGTIEPQRQKVIESIQSGVAKGTPISREMEEAQAARLRLEEFYKQRNERRASRKNTIEEFSDGGIATKPSIAGEAGPEAVIPLKNGSIPLKIDFDPMVKVLQTNNDLIERLTRSMEDSKDIQQQILNASY
jgi:hypothetical protein